MYDSEQNFLLQKAGRLNIVLRNQSEKLEMYSTVL